MNSVARAYRMGAETQRKLIAAWLRAYLHNPDANFEDAADTIEANAMTVDPQKSPLDASKRQ